MATTSVLFDLIARDKASAAFKSAAGGAEGLKTKIGGLAKSAGLLTGGLGLVAFGSSSVKAFAEAEESQNKLQAAFAKFPQLAGASLKPLQALNTELAKKTKFDDDTTASGQAVLAQFGLTAEQIKSVTPLLQDYAARTGKDLPTAATDMGKAILGQGRAFKTIGLNLKDTGSAAGNFAQLTDGLRSKVGGFAEKEGKTTSGRLAIMKNQFGELQETVGKALVPVLTDLAGKLARVFSWLSNLSPTTRTVLKVVAGLAAAAFVMVKATQAWSAVTKAFEVVQGALNIVLAANPIALVVVAIAALVAGVILAYKHSATFRAIVQAAFHAVAAAVGAVVVAVKAVIGFFANLAGSIASSVGAVVSWLKSNWDIVLTILTGPIGGIILIWRRFGDDIVGFFTGLPGRILSGLGNLAGLLVDAGSTLLSGLASGIAAGWTAVSTFFTGLPGTLLNLVGDLGTLLLGAGGAVIRGLYDGIKGLWDREIRGLLAIGNWILEVVGDLSKLLWGAGSAAIRGFYDGLKWLWDTEIKGLTNIGQWLLDAGQGTLAMGKKLWGWVKDGFIAIVNGIVAAWNKLDFGVHVHIPSWVPGIGGKGIDIDDVFPDIPLIKAALGFDGVVRRPTLFLAGEAGLPERVSIGGAGTAGPDSVTIHQHFQRDDHEHTAFATVRGVRLAAILNG